MSKVTMAYVVVNLIIVVSCLAASAQGAQSKSKIEESTSDATDITPVNDEIKDAIAYITEFLNDTNGYIEKGCSASQVKLSSLINKLIKSIASKFIIKEKDQLKIQIIQELPNINISSSNNIAISEFKLKNITMKGLDALVINALEYDVCKLSTEIDIDMPKLEITAIYTLNGTINNSPVSGAGNFALNADTVTIYRQSYMSCESANTSKTDCKLVNMNETVNIGVENVTMNLSGVEYMDLTESTINEQLNDYANKYLKSDKTHLKRIMANMFGYVMEKYLMNLSPEKTLIKVKEYLQITQIKKSQRKLSKVLKPITKLVFNAALTPFNSIFDINISI